MKKEVKKVDKSLNTLNKIVEKRFYVHYGSDLMRYKGILKSNKWHPKLVIKMVKFFQIKMTSHHTI